MSVFKTAYLGLGSNLGDKALNFARAIESIDARIGSVASVSRYYLASALISPENDAPQPDYLNAVLSLKTNLASEEILRKILEIEQCLGRTRDGHRRWMPRSIDIDLLALDDEIKDTKLLRLPHPEIQNRDFVLSPFFEIAPSWIHPLLRQNCFELLRDLRSKNARTFVIQPLV